MSDYKQQPDPNDLGALWIRQSKNGEYLSGKINGVDVVCWKNQHKTKDTHPDWKVKRSLPRDARPAPKPTADDIPF